MLPTEQGIPAARAEQYFGELKLQRKNWLKEVCEAAGIGAEEADNFAFRLIPKVIAWGRETIEQKTLQRWGLVEGRWVKIPVLTVFTKNGWPAERGADLLRASFIDFGTGDMEVVPRFWLGFEGINERGVYELDKRGLINIFSTVLDGSQCIGFRCESKPEAEEKRREMNKIFYIRLPKSREFLFDKDGFLRDEKRLAKAAEELGRIVKLDDQDLEPAEEAVYAAWLDDFCGTNDLAPAIISGLSIEAEGPKTFLLDGRVPVEISRTQAEDGGVVLAVKNITIYPPAERGATPRVLKHIVVPQGKGTVYLGELVVVISSEGKITQWVNRYGFGTDRTIKAEVVDSPEKLVLLLAKLEIAR